MSHDMLRAAIVRFLRTPDAAGLENRWAVLTQISHGIPSGLRPSDTVLRRCLSVMAAEGTLEAAKVKRLEPMLTYRGMAWRVAAHLVNSRRAAPVDAGRIRS